MRLDGKTPSSGSLISQGQQQKQEEIPEPFCITDYQPGQLSFVRYDYKCREVQLKEQKEKGKTSTSTIQPFVGGGATIRKPRS